MTDIASSSHPAVQLQYMELCVRYHVIFEVYSQYISPALENFVSLVHRDHPKTQFRSWYLLQRFVRSVRPHLGNVANIVVQALGDLLPIRAEISAQLDSDEDDGPGTRFSSQLCLYEAIGSVSSAKLVPEDTQVALMRSVIEPLSIDLSSNIDQAAKGDEKAQLQIHHLIMALGTLARGFSEWTPANTTTSPPASAVAAEFKKAAEAILMALSQLKHISSTVREAARFAFSRYIGVLGSQILAQLPQWIDGLLTNTSSRSEVALFMRNLDQVIFGFKSEIYDILNALLTPFLQRVFTGIGEVTTGTDDEIELAELKREYLAFLHVVLNNDLESVLVSEQNQPIFVLVINTVIHLAQDVQDYRTAKLALTVLGRFVANFGGPDVVAQINGAKTNGVHVIKAQLPGFDDFMMRRFSPICWSMPRNAAFDVKDAQARLALGEAAALQKAIYHKSGSPYVSFLQDSELTSVGMDATHIADYLQALTTLDVKGFQQYFKVGRSHLMLEIQN